ncbi:MAG: RdgB/HAM1 family non-canonical purine NTP pyrophosphatase [Humidesulfovibrio sp.]|jgi:XTP/dITP diphosphohydrolase|uniref:RdgB/HAM1 family non-canonical purine NTP pyrophosphatase n=1 Tax=Humidesulfovibrio sp. TaxID=2910988 RepID=UPI00273614E8|nr:RdgB/HAM1 family non-canonical purine NTP pyrophosphatase [Humidesulfovibrio sp.]MDP2848310.1 RdgB/HAM1 family non-canonical purine NTP pyrophosphatase [Humidesulfovibrio sp.]
MSQAKEPLKKVLVLATRNAGKIKELEALLAGLGFSVLGLGDFPHIGEIEETGTTFAENAALKARTVAQATGLVALADDSGLEVDALSGAPGVYSARYSDPDATDEKNNLKLLDALKDVAEAKRGCRFISLVAAIAPNGAELLAEGRWEGRVLPSPRGAGGFGYDPLFLDQNLGQSAAELSPAEKNARSHRGRALRALLENWPDFWARASR